MIEEDKGHLTTEEAREMLYRIYPCAEAGDFAGANVYPVIINWYKEWGLSTYGPAIYAAYQLGVMSGKRIERMKRK